MPDQSPDSYDLNDATPKELLAIMRSEMVIPIDLIKGYAHLLKTGLSEENSIERLQEFRDWVEQIIITVEKLEKWRIEFPNQSQ